MKYFKLIYLGSFFYIFNIRVYGNPTILDSRHKPCSFERTTDFHRAVLSKDYGKIKENLMKRAFFVLSKRDERGRTALGLAIQHRFKDVARIIVHRDEHIHPKSKCKMYPTPLHRAIFWNNIDAINYYLLYGKEIYFDTKDEFGQTPLAFAVESDHKALADILVGRVKEIQAKGFRKLGRNKLHLAAIANRKDVVSYYAKYRDRSYFNKKDIYGRTPLSYALEFSSKEAIRLFMRNVPWDMQYQAFNYPPIRNQVELAAERNRPDIAEFHLRFNAGYEKEYLLKNRKGLNPLHIAALRGHCDVLKAILKYYVKDEGDARYINLQTDHGKYTALHLAAKHDHLACVRVLLEYNADTFIENDQDLTPWREYKLKGKKNLTLDQQKIRELLKHSRKYDVG